MLACLPHTLSAAELNSYFPRFEAPPDDEHDDVVQHSGPFVAAVQREIDGITNATARWGRTSKIPAGDQPSILEFSSSDADDVLLLSLECCDANTLLPAEGCPGVVPPGVAPSRPTQAVDNDNYDHPSQLMKGVGSQPGNPRTGR